MINIIGIWFQVQSDITTVPIIKLSTMEELKQKSKTPNIYFWKTQIKNSIAKTEITHLSSLKRKIKNKWKPTKNYLLFFVGYSQDSSESRRLALNNINLKI